MGTTDKVLQFNKVTREEFIEFRDSYPGQPLLYSSWEDPTTKEKGGFYYKDGVKEPGNVVINIFIKQPGPDNDFKETEYFVANEPLISGASAIKECILNTVSDLVTNFVYYDRKEDEQLNVIQLNDAVASGIITLEEMVTQFKNDLEAAFKEEEG